MATRSRDGSVYQRHDHETCPPLNADGKRPPHRCLGRWVSTVDLGHVGGRRRRRTIYARSERDARSERRRLLREVEQGRLGDDTTLAQWLDHWVTEIAPESMGERSRRNHLGHIKHWIVPMLGRIRLSELRPDDVRRLRRHLETAPARRGGGTLSSTTARYVMTTLTSALAAAEAERRIAWNPAKSVAKPALTGEHHSGWADPDHARAMIDHGLDALEQARFAVALYGGLRQGEALGLTWDRVDIRRRRAAQTVHRLPRMAGWLSARRSASHPTPRRTGHHRHAAQGAGGARVHHRRDSGPQARQLGHRTLLRPRAGRRTEGRDRAALTFIRCE